MARRLVAGVDCSTQSTKVLIIDIDNGELIADQKISSLLTVNGVRIILEDGSWGLIRASSNSPNLVVVCESPISIEIMKEIFNSLNDILSKFSEIGEYDQKI